MANSVTRLEPRNVAVAITPEVEQALRAIAYSARAGEDEISIRRRITPAVASAISVRLADARGHLAPATRRDAKHHLGPTLALVAPAGMSEDDQTMWLAAAMEALSGIPADLLEAGCVAARRTVDHPAKIVAAIHAAVGKMWDGRRATLRSALAMHRIAALPAPEEVEVATPEAAAEALGRFSGIIGAETPRPARPLPTIDDYLALGVSAGEARAMVEMQARAA